MYCFRCSNKLVECEDTLYCESGDMFLSRNVHAVLLEAIQDTPLTTTPNVHSASAGKPWFCPRCASQLVDDKSSFIGKQCPQCGIILSSGLVRALVELHPHQEVVQPDPPKDDILWDTVELFEFMLQRCDRLLQSIRSPEFPAAGEADEMKIAIAGFSEFR